MAGIKVLIAGESWVTTSTHFKGWDFFSSTTFHTGGDHLQRALEKQGIVVEHMPSHIASTEFPLTAAALGAYGVVILATLAQTLCSSTRKRGFTGGRCQIVGGRWRSTCMEAADWRWPAATTVLGVSTGRPTIIGRPSRRCCP